jgi:AN1-type zinc finger protein 1
VLNTTTSPATRCVCGHLFCLKHRHPSDHACPGAAPAAQKSALLQNSTMSKDTLLLKLKEWSLKRKSSSTGEEKTKSGGLRGLIRSKSNQPNSIQQRGMELGRLKREAKGDTKIPEQDRIYFHGEGPPNLTTTLTSAAQVIRKPVFVSKVIFFDNQS